jgi:hypothetical protein
MTFNTWIDTLLSEKNISGDDMLIAEGPSGPNHIPVSMLVDQIKAAPEHERKGIKNMLVRIDFQAPGRKPVLDYLAHLAKAIAH